MRFKTIQIINYKSFLDSGVIDLSPGFNVIVGKNDAGKSSLIEALSLQLNMNNPHRSLLTIPDVASSFEQSSTTRASVEITQEELAKILSRHQSFCFSRHNGEEHITTGNRIQSVLANPEIFVGERTGPNFNWLEANISTETIWLKVQNLNYPTGFLPALDNFGNKQDLSYAEIIFSNFASQMYTFRAERLNIGECVVGANPILQPNASNLAEVLNLLISSNPRRFERFLNHVKTVFPHITQITAPIVSGNTAKVMVWSISPDSERTDLAVPLSESGTGIGQVLAMLYIVVMAEASKVIIIDEPQSFLHPGAVRKLIEIFRGYSDNQYIIATHSPTAITAADTESLILIRRVEHKSIIEIIEARNQNNLRTFLAEVGARLSDVFGADRVMWVEGKTEELCFPVIIKELIKIPLLGTQVLAVQSTADLEGKLANRVFEVYYRLTSVTTLLPPAMAFLLDQEGKSDSDMKKIEEKSRGLVQWLPRRMYENYLLDPFSITSILNEDDPEQNTAVKAENIQDWLTENATKQHYFDRGAQIPEYPSQEWHKKVHAAKILADMFGDLTNQRVSYNKVVHGLRLTKLLVTQPTQEILELGDFLQRLLNSSKM
jgi:predicted ATPase